MPIEPIRVRYGPLVRHGSMMRYRGRMFAWPIAAALLMACAGSAFPVRAQEAVRDIVFPVQGAVSYQDDFGDARSGHSHEGVDIHGEKMQPLLAAVDGHVDYIVDPEASWGYAVVIRDAEGYTYHYLHVNNDMPGTDDGNGGVEHAYAPGVRRGARVVKGQHIAWMGDSGNAESVGAHLHFEIRYQRDPIDPYPSLQAAERPGLYDVQQTLASATTINEDKRLQPSGNAVCASGELMKVADNDAVYYCGADGRRYAFPNQRVYESWYTGFSGVRTVSPEQMAAARLGGNVTYRPGTRLVKITTDSKVYAVGRGGVLRWVATPDIAAELYGADWAKTVHDIPDAFFFSYTVGDPITTAI